MEKYDWENNWLKGHQYANILTRMDEYCAEFNFQKCAPKEHPENIYTCPFNGQIYFSRANSLGNDVGFPRLGYKKHYKWKKMNFTTDLPKCNAIVSYLVATASNIHSKGGNEPVFRMHVVILKIKQEE